MLAYNMQKPRINGNPEATSSGNVSPGYVFVMGANAGYFAAIISSWSSIVRKVRV